MRKSDGVRVHNKEERWGESSQTYAKRNGIGGGNPAN